ncbi:MAG: hypothetical protein CMJ19_20885 [Phycisphaeraceae bacterium]|nr:hypothetical protein [Phycisphaeraceae bacterium]
MANRKRYTQIAELLQRRIHQGDYTGKPLPSEEFLAMETGVSRMTARRAILHLMDQGIITRQPGSRAVPNDKNKSILPSLAMLTPACSSESITRWRYDIERTASEMNLRVRPVEYVHEDDPSIRETLDEYQGVFFVPTAKLPKLIESWQDYRAKLMCISADLTHLHIPSIWDFPPQGADMVLEHMYEIGCRNVMCLNVQPMDTVINAWIDSYQRWVKRHNLTEHMHDTPRALLSRGACEEATNEFKNNPGKYDGVFATTLPAALGSIRAAHNCGLKIGKEMAVATVDGGVFFREYLPDITCVDAPDLVPVIKRAIEWILGKSRSKQNPGMLVPDVLKLYKGESTLGFASTPR